MVKTPIPRQRQEHAMQAEGGERTSSLQAAVRLHTLVSNGHDEAPGP